MAIKQVTVPNIGDYKDVDVIEVNVKVGDVIQEEDSLITLETDKASMEVPAPFSGTVKEVSVKVGDKVSESSLVLLVETDAVNTNETASSTILTQSAVEQGSQQQIAAAQMLEIKVPDIGDYKDVDVIEVNVKPGDEIKEEDSLATLETDKASMEIPSPYTGKVVDVKITVGDKVSKGDLVLTLLVSQGQVATENKISKAAQVEEVVKSPVVEQAAIVSKVPNTNAHASPAVRRLARILGIDLSRVIATGRKGRITKEDCDNYIKKAVQSLQTGQVSSGGGLDLLPDPQVDFAKFGEIEVEALSRINKLSAKNLARNWVKIPHVTFYDDADITDLEAFRNAKKTAAEKAGVKVTPLSFLIKAAATALQEYPRFNSSLSNDGEGLIVKKYYHIGFATDTPKGLVVPVIKNADQKGIFEISREIMDLVKKGREGKLKPDDMQGATFTISSLGILGTTAFTPIINMPEVAIMGVSKSAIKPVWNGTEFIPRTMLPLSLSTDHRVIDGALAAQFLTRYCAILADLREMLL
ncbi:dihydrolipoyllysine-residue acetyltransferase [Fastidiosibacter lacustris]|uniref:dihydrolipoyllysine-residue acetyltransferase n=1 Tax=Fastidiosibacter lacustris TaxID=2056695 RepID=UPI000E3524E1|nr:dihydrolipoyllysine-residue acetyltransferase [Fastidiosibacter lacustris]